PIVERRVEAVAALAAVLPVVDRRTGDAAMARDARLQIVETRGRDALLAVGALRVAAARADDLARLPAARQIVLRRRRTARLALVVELDVLPRAELLRVPVAG